MSPLSLHLPRDQAALLALALAAGLVLSNPYVGYWDSYDYLAQMIEGRPSTLMLGRPLFIGAGWLLARAWSAVGGQLEALHWPVRAVVLLSLPLATLSARRLFLALGADRPLAWRAAALLAASPALAVTSGMVLTEGPMLALALSGLALYAEGLRDGRLPRVLLGAALCGLAVGVREQALMLAPHLFLAGRRSWQLAGAALALALASAPPLALAIREPGYLNQLGAWSGSMAAERARHPLGPEQLALWASWVGALQPAALLALPGAVALWRSAPAPLARFAAIQIALLAVLAGYQDLVYGPRYLLVATPGLALAVARGLGPRRGVLAALLAVQLGGAWVVQRDEWRLHVLAGGYSATLDALPRGAV